MVADSFPDQMEARCSIKIEDYILDSYTPAKLPEQYLDVELCEGFSGAPEESTSKKLHGQQRCANLSFPFARSPVATVHVAATRKLLARHKPASQVQVLEMAFSTGDSLPDVEFQPGDTIGVLATNSQADVDFVLQAIKQEVEATTCCRVKLKSSYVKKSAKLPGHVPELSTPREILSDCLSLRAVPKKQFLRALAECCGNKQEQRFFHSLSAKEGSHLYNKLILEQGYNLLDLLALCPTCCPSLALLIQHLPRLLPRPYSIACSPLASEGKELKIIFSLLSLRPGVATKMLYDLSEELQQGGRPYVHLYFRETNKFRYTQDDTANGCIMIGVGTGVAPFLGFLEHKQLMRDEQKFSHPTGGETWLFSGSKTPEKAFGRKQFEDFEACGILKCHHEAFSRVADWPYKYVQDLLLANCEKFVDFFMQPSTRLYVCADGAGISKSIESGIKQCLMQSLAVDDEQANELIKEFRSVGKYCEDLWI